MDVGVEFGHYRVVEHIGRGGMADVWSARDLRLSRTVAIKTVARDLSQDMDPLRLFEREAKTIAALEHPHILPIYDFGDYGNQLYIVMRYVSGGSLEDLLEDGPLPLDIALRHARAISEALDYAHSNNVVHLDLKPSNILLDSNQSPYLADFGLAAVLGPEGRTKNPGSGTLLYMAPEQLTSDSLDHRVDIYSFCILLYHMLTGQLPFDAVTPLALRQLQTQEPLPDLSMIALNLPTGITEVLRLGTAIDAARRPARLSELMREFETALRPVKRSTAELAGVSADMLIESEADLADMATQPSSGPEAQARREAQDIYQRARRIWAHGQGRFLLGITHFMLINDYYMQAERYNLKLDDAGMQMLLRGAIEYDHEIDHWWQRLPDDSRRWVALHAIRSENAPARVRAFRLLSQVPDADVPIIVKQVAQALQLESNEEALIAGIETLAARSSQGLVISGIIDYTPARAARRRTSQVFELITEQLQLRPPSVWREVVFSPEIDLLLAQIALNAQYRSVRELAARTIGRLYSLTAVRELATHQRKGTRRALRALALVRDEAPSLPGEVSGQARFYAWMANTARRLSENPMRIVWRFVFAVVCGFVAIWFNTYVTYRTEAIFTPSRWGTSVAIGLTVSVFLGALTLLAEELPSRLRGFWLWWARLLMSSFFGALLGTAVWAAYTYMFLEFVPEWDVILFAGFGAGLGYVLTTMFNPPGWAAFLVTAACIYFPLYMAFENNLPPVLYYDNPEQIFSLTIPVTLLIAMGSYAQLLWRDLRNFLR